MAFPTGVSVNECAAHYTPNVGEIRTLGNKDILKIDFGVHFDGYLIDSAFTVNFNPVLEPLKKATEEATNAGLKIAGADILISEVTAAIEEVLTSFEVVEPNGNILP
ncbi:MAG: Methionine aminopeptidase 2, partial [Paramarteilia canceri]